MSTWLRIGEAARLLNLLVDTLRNWDNANRFRALRTVGGHRRYDRATVLQLADWVKAPKTQPRNRLDASLRPRFHRSDPGQPHHPHPATHQPRSQPDPHTLTLLRRLEAELSIPTAERQRKS